MIILTKLVSLFIEEMPLLWNESCQLKDPSILPMEGKCTEVISKKKWKMSHATKPFPYAQKNIYSTLVELGSIYLSVTGLISLHMMFVNFTSAAAYGKLSSFKVWVKFHCMHMPQFLCSFIICEHLDYIHLLAVVKMAQHLTHSISQT